MSHRTLLRCVFAFVLTLLATTTAHALIFRAYLASDGSDANPCTLPQPCRLLPAALAAVMDGGEIWMLDSANYNAATVTIGKSVSILAVPGAVGSVVAVGGPAITVLAPSLTVALRNLVIVPLPGGGGTSGVDLTAASSLTIEHCLIANLASGGVAVLGAGTLKITDTIIRNTGAWAIELGQGMTATISRTQMLGNANGGVFVYAIGSTTTTASVTDSVISGGNDGVRAYPSSAGSTAKVFVTRSTIERTTAALCSQTDGVGSSLVTVSYSMVTNNTNGWLQSGVGSVIQSLGNNHIADNANTTGVLTPVPMQ